VCGALNCGSNSRSIGLIFFWFIQQIRHPPKALRAADKEKILFRQRQAIDENVT
jgi:hypothetical protein